MLKVHSPSTNLVNVTPGLQGKHKHGNETRQVVGISFLTPVGQTKVFCVPQFGLDFVFIKATKVITLTAGGLKFFMTRPDITGLELVREK